MKRLKKYKNDFSKGKFSLKRENKVWEINVKINMKKETNILKFDLQQHMKEILNLA